MIVAYIPDNEISTEKILPADHPFLKHQIVHILRALSELRHVLITIKSQIKVLIIVVSDHHALALLVPYRDYLIDLKTIFILPQDNRETFTLAASFFPNYVSYRGSDFSDIQAVLEKILSK